MTFKEYLHQVEPKPMPDVQLYPEDCEYIRWCAYHCTEDNRTKNYNHIALKINNQTYSYIVPMGEVRLYTPEQKPSCFRMMALPINKQT